MEYIATVLLFLIGLGEAIIGFRYLQSAKTSEGIQFDSKYFALAVLNWGIGLVVMLLSVRLYILAGQIMFP